MSAERPIAPRVGARPKLSTEEFQQFIHQIDDLVDKLRAVTGDKDILQFRQKLLDEFVISLDVVRDWREYIGVLLSEIHAIVDACALFMLSRAGNATYDLEVFWRANPAETTRCAVERQVMLRIRSSEEITRDTCIIAHHNSADTDRKLPELSPNQGELAPCSLLLDSSHASGVVGIGVQPEIARSPEQNGEIKSILASLLALTDSVKAIHTHTQGLAYDATRDPLTNLYNQRVFWALFHYELKRAESHGHPVALMVIDLDDLKIINDRYGPAVGDCFLQAFAESIQGTIPDEDTLARYGGDKFALLLPDTDQQSAWHLAAHMVEAIDGISLPAADDSQVKGTASIGIAAYPRHGKDPQHLFLIADGMVHKAKRYGKNAVCVPSDEEVAVVLRAETGPASDDPPS